MFSVVLVVMVDEVVVWEGDVVVVYVVEVCVWLLIGYVVGIVECVGIGGWLGYGWLV